MSRHNLDRADVDYAELAKELSNRLGRNVAVSAQTPGTVDLDGTVLPGILLLIDGDTGEELKGVDDLQVQDVVTRHVPPPPPVHPLDELSTALETVNNVADLKGALGSYVERERRRVGLPPRAGRIQR